MLYQEMYIFLENTEESKVRLQELSNPNIRANVLKVALRVRRIQLHLLLHVFDDNRCFLTITLHIIGRDYLLKIQTQRLRRRHIRYAQNPFHFEGNLYNLLWFGVGGIHLEVLSLRYLSRLR